MSDDTYIDSDIRKQVIQATLGGTALGELKRNMHKKEVKEKEKFPVFAYATDAYDKKVVSSRRVVSHFCHSCGSPTVESSSNFCSSCGVNLRESRENKDHADDTPESGESPLRGEPREVDEGSSLNATLGKVLQNKEELDDLSESVKSGLRQEVMSGINTPLLKKIMSGVHNR